jgi:hypothetical protein
MNKAFDPPRDVSRATLDTFVSARICSHDDTAKIHEITNPVSYVVCRSHALQLETSSFWILKGNV